MHHTKLGGVADMTEGWVAIQSHHDRLEKWAAKKSQEVQERQMQVQHLEQNKPAQQHWLWPAGKKATLQKNTWRSWWTSQTWDSNPTLWQRQLNTFWAVLAKMQPAGWGTWLLPHLVVVRVSSFGILSRRQT